MRQDVQISSFAAGELSPLFSGRTDHEKYYIGAETLLNYVCLPQGGITRRPGTKYSDACLLQAYKPRLIPFIFSTVQAYMLEFSEGIIRVFMNEFPVLNGGSFVTIVTPYHWQDLPMLKYVQSADVLYLFHGSYPTFKLTRTSHITWSLVQVDFIDGPYMPVDISPTTLTASGVSGSVTVTASATAGINGGTGFKATDVGRLIRWSTKFAAGIPPTSPPAGAAYGYLKITAWTDALHVTATVQQKSGKPDVLTGIRPGTLDGAGPTNNWRLGRFSATTGYPFCGTFFQERLALGGNNQVPNAVWLSVTGDFENFAPTDWDGAVLATSGIEFIISDDQVNPINWLISAGSAQQAQLGIGTGGAEDVMSASGSNQALTATNVQVYRETELTSNKTVKPAHIGKAVMFANGPGLRLHEWVFEWTVNGYLGSNMAVIAEHLPKPGLEQIAYQRSPHSILWCQREDGYLIALTYLREEKVFAWHRHELGGSFYGGWPIVESIACLPSPDGNYDQLWLAVRRRVNGADFRSIEVMQPFFDSKMVPLEQAWFADCALALPFTAPAAALACEGTSGVDQLFTASAPVFTALSVGAFIAYHGGFVKVTGFIDTTHVTGTFIRNADHAGPAVAGTWNYAEAKASAAGLTHLEGQTVVVLGDGANYGKQPVIAGTILFDPPAAFVVAGLPYKSRLVTMPMVPIRAAGSAEGRTKRIDTLYLRFFESVSCEYGARTTDDMSDLQTDELERLEVRSAGVPIGWPVPLFTGIRRVNYPGGYDREGQTIVQEDGPLPLTVLSLGARADIGDVAMP